MAHFCAQCGLMLEVGAQGVRGAGRAPHRDALPAPEGYESIREAVDLHYRCEAASGGSLLLGTEPLTVTAFNGGYDLCEVVLRVWVRNAAGQELVAVEREIQEWPRGESVELEIPSYELPDIVRALSVELVTAEFKTQA